MKIYLMKQMNKRYYENLYHENMKLILFVSFFLFEKMRIIYKYAFTHILKE